jgi:hypothetical protein
VSYADLLTSVLWRNRQIVVCLVVRTKPRNCRADFNAQITKPELLVLRTKSINSSTLVLRPNQETHAPRLLVYSADCTQRHPTSRSSDHRVPGMCLTILGPLHQVSYSCHDPHRYLPYHTCHLYTTRQANVILHTNYDKGKNLLNVLNLNSSLTMSMTHHNQTKELTTCFLRELVHFFMGKNASEH